MGQKRGRFGRVTGATLRRVPGKFLLNKCYSIERGLITKRVEPNLTHRQRRTRVYLDDESQGVLKQFESQFDDGGIEVGNGFNHCYSVPYSLNKLRRWELPDLLKDNIVFDSSHETNDFEVVLVEHSIGFYGSSSTDCIGIHKSKGNVRSKTPRGKYAVERNLLEVEQNAKVSSIHRNSGNQKKPKNKVGVETSTPPTRLKYEVTYERPLEQYPNFKTRDYNRHSRDLGKVELREPRKGIHKMHNFDFNEDDESYYSDHFDTDDGYLGDEESMIYFNDPEFSMGPSPPSFADYLDFSKKPVKLKSEKKKSRKRVEQTEHSKKDRKVLIRSPDVPSTSTDETSVSDVMVTTPSLAPLIPTSHLINITKSSATSECLETAFKSCYIEGASLPRRFLIDVTSHLHQVLQKQGRCKVVEHLQRTGHKIVLIFVKNNEETESFVNYSWKENGEESLNEVDEFRVCLFGFDDELHNQYGNLLMSYLNDSKSFSVTDVVTIVKTVTEQLPINQFDVDKKIATDQMSHLTLKALQDHLQQVSKVMTPHDLYQQNVVKETPKKINTHVKPSTCNICDVDLLPSTDGSYATALNVCQHWFCDDCWRHHIHTRVGRGDCSILCPEFKCDSKLDIPTLMSLVTTKTFQNHITHRQNRMVDSDPSWHWCPDPSCGHVGRVCQSKDELGFISCNCGKSWCVGCKGDVHWPALCQQAEEYIKIIKKREEDKRAQKITTVQVKRCPHCGRVMEKNGGCPNMTCVCGNHFCWVCLKPHYYITACNKSAKTLETVELYPVLLSVTKDELLSKATSFRKLTSKSVFERIKRNVIRLFLMMHSKTIRQNSSNEKTAVKNNLPVVETRICSWCSNEEHMKMYTEAVEMAKEVAEFYTETYHLLEWTFVFMAYLRNNRMLRVVSKQLMKLIFILEMLDEIPSKTRTIVEMKEAKAALINLLKNGRKWRKILYHSADQERSRNMEKI